MDLSAYSLRKLGLELNYSGVLVGSCLFLDVLLDLLLELVGRLCSLYENDASLYDLTSYLVGSGRNATLEDVRKLHDNAFDLEGTDAVSRGLDNVVNTSDVPIEAVLISPSGKSKRCASEKLLPAEPISTVSVTTRSRSPTIPLPLLTNTGRLREASSSHSMRRKATATAMSRDTV